MESSPSYMLIALCLLLFIALGALSLLLINKSERITHLQNLLARLQASFDNLDEQAKLIVKTDLELNKAQEELDKRLGGLDALQKISRLTSTTLDEAEMFDRLQQALLTNLDFEKNLVLIYDKTQALRGRVLIGFTSQFIDDLIPTLQNQTNILQSLKEGTPCSSISSQKEQRDKIMALFDVEHFIFTPILSQKDVIGFLFVGNQSNTSAVTQGDEEIIAVLATQIGQSLENARLFEQVFQSRQILESKIHERTSQLESALKEVQSISKTKTEFISAVSHELRTPLTSIKGYASILLAGKLGQIPDQVRERLSKINTHSDNLVQFINELLDISRIESGRVEMKMSECHLPEMIENVHDLLTPQMKEKNIHWETRIDPSIPKMSLDISQAERIFINIIGNAIKFTPPQGKISVHARRDAEFVTVEISDTGIGISENDLGRLFNEFYRVDNVINQNVKGTGLGLSLAKKIVEAHHGTLWVTSRLHEGTTFHLTLPLQYPQNPKNPNHEGTTP